MSKSRYYQSDKFARQILEHVIDQALKNLGDAGFLVA